MCFPVIPETAAQKTMPKYNTGASLHCYVWAIWKYPNPVGQQIIV